LCYKRRDPVRKRGVSTDSSVHFQAFVADQTNGTWHTAMEVPGTAVRNGVVRPESWAWGRPVGHATRTGRYARRRWRI